MTPMDPEGNIQLPIIAVNMITTQILMSVESQGSLFQQTRLTEKEYRARWTAHKTQRLH